MVLDRHPDAVLFGHLDGFSKHPRQALDLRTVWLVAELQAATYHAHHTCTDTPGGFETPDHLGVGVLVRAALQAVGMSPREHAFQAVLIEKSADTCQVFGIHTRNEAGFQ